MSEKLGSGSERHNEQELASLIFDAAETFLDQNLATQTATYGAAKSGILFGAQSRATLRGVETLRNTLHPDAGAIVDEESYNKLLVIDDDETGERTVYGSSYLVTERGATARMFTLYILHQDIYRLLAVYTNGGGDLWTRDSIEIQLGDFERYAYQVVGDEHATMLGPILSGMLRDGTTLEGELAKLHYSLMSADHIDSEEFINSVRTHFLHKRESGKFGLLMHEMAAEMSVERMQKILDHLEGGPLAIAVFDENQPL